MATTRSRLIVIVVGLTLCGAGLVVLVLPGPGILTVLIGLLVLAGLGALAVLVPATQRLLDRQTTNLGVTTTTAPRVDAPTIVTKEG
jgi:hypothetical protein